MSYDWMNGASQIPTSPFGQIGGAMSNIGQAASQWMQILQMRENAARRNLEMILSMPNLPPDAKQQAIQQYTDSTKRMPSWMRFNWPTQQVPGPVTQPGQPAIPGGPGETRGPTERGEAIPPTPAVPEVRGPSTRQFVVPPSPVGQRPVKDVLAGNPILQRIPQNIQDMPWSDAIQIMPDLGKYAEQGALTQQGLSVGDAVRGYRVRQGMEEPAKALLTRLDQAVQTGQIKLDQAIGLIDKSPYFINPQADQVRFHGRQLEAQKRLETLLAQAGKLAEAGNFEAAAIKREEAQRALAVANQALQSDAQNAGIQFQGLPVKIPTDADLRSAGAHTARQEAREDQRLQMAMQSLGIRQQELQINAARLGISEQDLGLRLAAAADKIPEGDKLAITRWQNVLDTNDPNSPTYKRAQEALNTLYTRNHVPLQAEAKGTKPGTAGKLSEKEIWDKLRQTYPKKITDAIQRYIHGSPTPDDTKIINSNVTIQDWIKQLRAAQGARPPKQPASPQTPTPQTPSTKGPDQEHAAILGDPKKQANKKVTLSDKTVWVSDGTQWTQVSAP